MTINLGIIGCGNFAINRLIPAITNIENIKLFAIHNRSPQKANKIKIEHQIPYSTNDESDLINHPNVDAILITSPHFMHKKHILLAAKTNKPILCEKPLSLDKQSVLEIYDNIPKNYPLLVGQCYRFKNSIIKAKEMIQKGAIGKVQAISIIMHIPLKKHPWKLEQNYGGGILLDVGIHAVDTISFLLNKKFLSIKSIGNFRKDKNSQPVETTVSTLAKLENDIIANISISYDLPYKNSITITGSNGILEGNYILRQATDDKEFLVFQDCNDTSHNCNFSKNNIYEEEIKHFIDVITKDTTTDLLGIKTIENYQVLDDIRKSLHT